MDQVINELKSILIKYDYPDVDQLEDFAIGILISLPERLGTIVWLLNKICVEMKMVIVNETKEDAIRKLMELGLCKDVHVSGQFLDCTIDKNKEIALFQRIFYYLNTLAEYKEDYEDDDDGEGPTDVIDEYLKMYNDISKEMKTIQIPDTASPINIEERRANVRALEEELKNLQEEYRTLSEENNDEELTSLPDGEKLVEFRRMCEQISAIDAPSVPTADLVNINVEASALRNSIEKLSEIIELGEQAKDFDDIELDKDYVEQSKEMQDFNLIPIVDLLREIKELSDAANREDPVN